MLWVGWFGFNAGSNLEANAFAALAFINTMTRPPPPASTWAVIEQIVHKKPSLLGAASGAVAGLVAITPAAGFAAPDDRRSCSAAVASVVCFFFVTTVKNKLGYDDTLDVFGVHCVGGIIGAIGTGDRRRPGARRPGLVRLHRVPRRCAGELRHRRPGADPDQGGRH